MGTAGTKRYFMLIGALVTVAVGYSWYWHSVAENIRADVPEFMKIARKAGYLVDLAEPDVSGFPYRLIVNFPTLDLASRRGDGPGQAGWRLHTEGVTGYAQPWNLSHVIVEFSNSLAFSWRDHTQVIESERAVLSLSLDGDALHRLSLEAEGVSVSSPAGDSLWTAGRLQAHMQPRRDGNEAAAGTQISLKVENVDLPEQMSGVLDRQVQLVRAAGLLNDWTPSFGRMPGLGEWADNGGTMVLDDFEVSWQPLEIEGSGVLALDATRRPEGSIHASLRGHGALVDLLEATDILSPGKAAATRAALGMLQSSQPPSGGRLTVPIELQSGRLYLGPIKLLRLPAF